MKKFRTKIDTPWVKKGEVFISSKQNQYRWSIENTDADYFNGDPADYPEYFEEMPEMPDVEKLAEWLHYTQFIGREDIRGHFAWEKSHPIFKESKLKMAKAILDAGVDVSKLIGGME